MTRGFYIKAVFPADFTFTVISFLVTCLRYFNLEDRQNVILFVNFPFRREMCVSFWYYSKLCVKVDYYPMAFQNPEKSARAIGFYLNLLKYR